MNPEAEEPVGSGSEQSGWRVTDKPKKEWRQSDTMGVSMNRVLAQRLTALVCLVAFGCGQTVFAALGVRCTDESGRTRVELACSKTAAGSCATACESGAPAKQEAAPDAACAESGQGHEDHEPAAPCRDEPLAKRIDGLTARTGGASEVAKLFVTMVVAATVHAWASAWDGAATAEGLARAARWAFAPDRPPGNLAQLRTVVLIV